MDRTREFKSQIQPMKKFKFYWLGGEIEEGEGISVSDAFTRLGYGHGAMKALDYYEEIK